MKKAENDKKDEKERSRHEKPLNGKRNSSLVFSIPELLENILHWLPMADLLINAQRVDRYFHTTIVSSPCLQRQLFFQLDPHHRAVCWSTSSDCNRPTDDINDQIECSLNPLLWKRFPLLPEHIAGRIEHCFSTGTSGWTHFGWKRLSNRRVAFVRKEASWRRMLISQFPAYKLGILNGRSGIHGTLKWDTVRASNGITMGTLSDLIGRLAEGLCITDHVYWFEMQDGKEIDGNVLGPIIQYSPNPQNWAECCIELEREGFEPVEAA